MKKTITITTGLLCLTLQSSRAGTYEGIYSGTFWGVSGGEFVSIVKEDNTMLIWTYDATWDEWSRDTFALGSGGSFSGRVDDTWVNGTIVGSSLSGSGTNPFGTIYLGGSRKPDSGSANHFVGYYEGMAYSNLDTYFCDFLIAADGAVWYYSLGNVYGEGGGKGTIESSGAFRVLDLDGTVYTGTVDDRAFNVLNGTFSGGGEYGTLNFTRVISFTHLPSVAAYKPRVTRVPNGTLQLRMETHERRSYTVCRSTDLKNWSARDTFRGTGSELIYAETPPAGRVFYCVEINE
jgi:hypothetical protein